MSFRAFLDELKKGLPASGYLLAASDPFLHSEACSRIRALVPSEERDFTYHTFDLNAAAAEKMPFDRILDVLNTVPFFSGRKYVVVENLQKIAKKEVKGLAAYLAAPSQTSLLVLLFQGALKDLKKDMKEALQGLRQIPLDIREKDIPLWLRDLARSQGFELSAEGADYLLGTIGPDLGMLSSEIDKLILIGKSPVGREDIASLIEGKRTYNAFDLVNAIRAGDAEKTFRIYHVLRESDEPAGLLGALNWQYGQMTPNRNSPSDREFRHRIFGLLNKADVNVKSSGGVYPLELLLIRLLRTSGKR